MRDLSAREIKDLEVQMLVEFAKICEQNNILYSLCGGTLLGAIRHKGFIPWDDDIDVMLPRPDFDRLCEVIRQNKAFLPPYYKFISWFTEPKRDIPYIKMLDTRTVVEEEYMTNDPHLWIDIFAIDACPDDDNELRKIFKKSKAIRKIMFLKLSKPGTGKSRMKAIGKDALRTLLKPVSLKYLCSKLIKLSGRYNFDECSKIGCIQWGYGPQERVDKKGWMTPINVEFEGYSFKSASNYDEYLSNVYGNYMELPPVEKRVSHDMSVKIMD